MTLETSPTAEEALELVAYLVSSAELRLSNPTFYGRFRLVEATARVLAPLAERAPPDARAFYAHLKHEIDDSQAPDDLVANVEERSETT